MAVEGASLLRPILAATLLAGTLDLSAAFVFAGMAGMGPVRVLQFVASGPFGDGAKDELAFAPVGVLVHYAIMACMAGAYMVAARRLPALLRRPVLFGLAYGLLLWFVMYWIVRPLRWENLPHPTDPKAIAGQLFCHLILVGIPIALIARRYLGPGAPGRAG